MDALRICLLLLLPCFAYSFDSEVTLVKTIGKEPDFTPICTNQTSNIIMMIMCRFKKRISGEECRLLYRDGGDFVHECDSRFTLKTMNQTVFLHLTNLTPADSGNYSCHCANLDGTFILLLNITVIDSDNQSDTVWGQFAGATLSSALTAAVFLIIILSVILGFIHRRHRHREQPEPGSHHPDEDVVEIEPYSTYIQKENGLYSTAVIQNCQVNYTDIFT